MIDEAVLEQLRERIDLPALVGRHVELRRAGANWKGRCPFHDDRTPSFTVPAVPVDKPFFYCFGCQAYGDAIDFLRQLRGLSFADAVQELAAEAGLVMAQKARPVTPLRATAKFKPSAAAKAGFEPLDDQALQLLKQWQQNLAGAADYLASRRIPMAVAKALGAGFLPAGDAMGANSEGRPTGYGPRVVFPHELPDGQVVNLYGRAIDDVDKAQRHRHLPRAKGLLNARALELPGELWLVEGAFDAAALMAAGVDKVVAVFGLAGFDWRWLGRSDLVIAVDHDEAGEATAQSLLEEAAYRGLKARRLPAEALGGLKDVAEAWRAGVLDIGQQRAELDEAGDIRRLVASIGEPPERHLAAGWAAFRAFADRFAALHLAEALAAGWTVPELFSLPSSRLGGDAGAVWALAGFRCEAVALDQATIVLRTPEGGRLTYRRGEVTGRLPWV